MPDWIDRQHITSSRVAVSFRALCSAEDLAACPLVFSPQSLRVCRRGGGGSQCGWFFGGGAASGTWHIHWQRAAAELCHSNQCEPFHHLQRPTLPRCGASQPERRTSDFRGWWGTCGGGQRTRWKPKIWTTECNDSAVSKHDLLRLLVETLNWTCSSTFLHFNLNTVSESFSTIGHWLDKHFHPPTLYWDSSKHLGSRCLKTLVIYYNVLWFGGKCFAQL